MPDNEAKVKISADTKDMHEGMDKAEEKVGQATATMAAAIEQMSAQMTAAIGQLQNSIKESFDQIKKAMDASEIEKSTQTVSDSVDEMSSETSRAFSKLKSTIKSAYSEIKQDAAAVGTAVGIDISSGWEKIEDAIRKVYEMLKKMAEQALIVYATFRLWGEFAATVVNRAFWTITALVAAFKSLSFIKGLFTGESYKSENIDALIAERNAIESLRKSLQLSTADAQALNDALGRLGINKSDIIGVYDGMRQSIQSNTDELDRLGVKYKDENGNLLDHRTIVENAKKVLDQYTEGWDRNQAAVAIGMGTYEQINDYLKANEQQLKASTDRLDEYGLRLGPEATAAMEKYQAAIREFNNEVRLMGLGLSRVISDAIMPALTDLANYFKEGWPSIVQAFRFFVASITTDLYLLKEVFQFAYESITGGLGSIWDILSSLGKAAVKFLRGDFEGAREALSEGWENARTRVNKSWEHIVDDARKNAKNVRLAWGVSNKEDIPSEKPASGKTWGPAPSKETGTEENRVPEWKAALEEMRLAEDAFLESSKKSNLAYWEDIKKNHKLSAEEDKAINHEILLLKKEIQKEDLQNDLEAIKLRMDREKTGSAERMRIYEEALVKIKTAYGEDSSQFKKALQEKEKLARENAQLLVQIQDSITDKNREIANIGLEIERENAAYKKSIGILSADEEIDILRNLENRKSTLEIAALQQKLAREKQGTLEYQKLLNQIETAQAQHNKALNSLNIKSAEEQSKTWTTLWQSLENNFSTAIQGMILGTSKFKNIVNTFMKAIAGTIIDTGVKMLANWVKVELAKTMATKTANAARTADTATASALTSAITTTQGAAEITTSAGVAAAGAAKSQAGIPVIGPELAIAAAAAMLAMVLGYKALVSAAGGWGKIPSDQLAMVHTDEMVLPAELSTGIRNMITSGQAGGGSSIKNSTFNIRAFDSKDVVKTLKKLKRNYSLSFA